MAKKSKSFYELKHYLYKTRKEREINSKLTIDIDLACRKVNMILGEMKNGKEKRT